MSRYSIILKKSPKEIEKERSEKIVQFGIDQDMDFKRMRTFSLEEGKDARIGIVYSDPKTLFYGSKVHFHGTYRFFCKSTKTRIAPCCTFDYPGKRSTFRIATIIVHYPGGPVQQLMETPDNVRVLPWVFGKIMYNKLQEICKVHPVTEHDFILKCPRNGGLFKHYDVVPCQNLLWQESEMRDRIMEIEYHLKRTIKNYLANDLLANDLLENDIVEIIRNSSDAINQTQEIATPMGYREREPLADANRFFQNAGRRRRPAELGSRRLQEIDLADFSAGETNEQES
jgi:hypothetical protein